MGRYGEYKTLQPKPLFLVLLEDTKDNYILQLRTNPYWLEPYRFRGNDAGELVLEVPEPIIQLACGSRQDVLEYAHRMFCVVPLDFKEHRRGDGPVEGSWRYEGGYVWMFRIDAPDVREGDDD